VNFQEIQLVKNFIEAFCSKPTENKTILLMDDVYFVMYCSYGQRSDIARRLA
jgi:rhodanese-related sulfurtransferase